MILNFGQMEEQLLHKFKGGEGTLAAKMNVDENGKIMLGKLEPGGSIGYHSHDTSSEMIYIISGAAEYNYEGTSELVEAGNCHYCPKGHSHSMRNAGTEPVVFFAVIPEQ